MPTSLPLPLALPLVAVQASANALGFAQYELQLRAGLVGQRVHLALHIAHEHPQDGSADAAAHLTTA